MMKEKEHVDVFLQLLREELWHLPHSCETIPQAAVPAVFKYAEEQCLQGLVINSLFERNADIGKDKIYKCFSLIRHIEINNSKLNSAVGRLSAILNKNSVRYLVFKGQTAAYYYPNPQLRMPGDIDFYCYGEDYSRAKNAIERELGIIFEPRDLVDRHDAFSYDGIRFEMHYKMEVLGSSRHQAYYDAIMDEAVKKPLYINIGGTGMATLNPTDNILHVFKHLFNHLLVEGVGLRQFCDLAMIIGNNADCVDAGALRCKLKRIGYWKAFLAVGALLVKYLGLPVGKFPFRLTASDYVWGDRIFKTVIGCGNFGRHNRKKTNSDIRKSIETARIAFGHCLRFFPLAPTDIVFLIPKRIMITLNKYL